MVGASIRGLTASGAATVESVQWISQQVVKVVFYDSDGREIRLRPADRPHPRRAGGSGQTWPPCHRGYGGGGVRAAEGAGRACEKGRPPSTARPHRRRTSRQMRWIGSHKRRAGSPRSQRQQNVCGLQNLVGPMPWLRIATDAVRFTSAGSVLPLCKSCILAVVLIEIIHSIHHA